MTTRNDIINGALELVGVKAADEDAQAADISTAAKTLNSMVKTFQAKGAHLWTRLDAYLFLVTGQAKYVIGTADATESYTATTTTADVAAGIKVIPLTSVTGLSVGDFLGVKLDDGTLTFSAVTLISTLNVTVTTGLASLATSGNAVYFYSVKLGKALRIPDARRNQSGTEIPMDQMAREDYLLLPNKDSSGTPNQFYYDPKVNTGDFFLWPTPTATDTFISMTYYKPLDAFDTSSSAPDFPDEWEEALEYQLAVRLCPKFTQPVPQEVAVLAISLLQDALDWDQGDADVQFVFGR